MSYLFQTALQPSTQYPALLVALPRHTEKLTANWRLTEFTWCANWKYLAYSLLFSALTDILKINQIFVSPWLIWIYFTWVEGLKAIRLLNTEGSTVACIAKNNKASIQYLFKLRNRIMYKNPATMIHDITFANSAWTDCPVRRWKLQFYILSRREKCLFRHIPSKSGILTLFCDVQCVVFKL